MSTRSIDFFMTRHECETVLLAIAEELSLHLILSIPGNPEQIEMASGAILFTMKSGKQAYWASLAKEPLSPAQRQSSHSHPAEWGWVNCTLPREEGSVLYRADLGCKSDYYQPDTKTIHENTVSIEIYVRAVKVFRKKLPFQTYIGPEGGVLKPSRGVKHSQGAVDWVSSGGRLKAWGEVAEYGIGPKTDGKKDRLL